MPMTMGFLRRVSSAGAITFVGGASATKLGATSGNTTIALNSGLTGGSRSSVQSGDLVIAVFATGSIADRTLSITDGTTGYTLIGSELYSNNTEDCNLRVAYKFMGGTPDTSTTFGFTGNANDQGAMAVYVFSGVNQTTPLDVAVTTATNTTAAANPPSITPSTAGSYIVVVGAAGYAGGSGDLYGTPSGITGFVATTTLTETYVAVLGIGHKNNWTSGAYDCPAYVNSANGSSGAWAAMSIALRPA